MCTGYICASFPTVSFSLDLVAVVVVVFAAAAHSIPLLVKHLLLCDDDEKLRCYGHGIHMSNSVSFRRLIVPSSSSLLLPFDHNLRLRLRLRPLHRHQHHHQHWHCQQSNQQHFHRHRRCCMNRCVQVKFAGLDRLNQQKLFVLVPLLQFR